VTGDQPCALPICALYARRRQGAGRSHTWSGRALRRLRRPAPLSLPRRPSAACSPDCSGRLVLPIARSHRMVIEPPRSTCGHRNVTVADKTTSIRLRSTIMKHTSTVRRYLSIFMAALFMFTSMVSLHAQATQAAMTSTHEVIAEQQLSVDRDELKAMLDDQAVQDKLASMGVSPEQVEQRINSLTADE